MAAVAGEREERKVVTVLFCDLVEFTSWSDLADPEDVRDTLATYHARVRREIERFGGSVEKFIGDAVMAVYGAPVAHEDDAERALLSALRIPPAIEELNESNQDLSLAVRIGVETGEAFVTVGAEQSGQGIAIGDVVNTASRLQGVAPTGGIVVGEGTHRLTRDFFDYEPLEPVQVKGKTGQLRVWVAKGARSRFGAELQRRPSTPWVDREDELELLKRSFARAVREPSVQLVTLMGEPGVGKSRLIKEFFAYIDDLTELVFWRQGRCLPYGEGVTFWALSEIVKAQAGILRSDRAQEAREKLTASVAALVDEQGEQEWVRARLSPLIGLAEPQTEGIDRAEAFSAWRRYFEVLASIHPLVIAIEDVHWADAALLDFVEHVVDWSADVPILILCTARPELFERDPRWGGGKRNSSTVSLAPLSDADARRLITALLPPHAPVEVQGLLIEQAGGNPLFAEEFARMLSDRPTLTSVVSSFPGLAPGVQTPESLQAIIAARLDTLSVEQKSLLQDASVVGKVFWPGALAAIEESDRGAVQAALHELTRKELVRPSRVSSVKDEEEYSFWHALIRDVAYAQIPRVRRARKHVAAARWIEDLAGERLSDQAELLAHHYDQALELTKSAGMADDVVPLEESTRRYWMIAGERAMGLDVSHAEKCFDRALRLLPAGNAERPGALARKADAAFDAGRYGDAQRTYEEAVQEFREQGDLLGVGACLDRLASVVWNLGDTAGCRARLVEAVEVLERQPPGSELADCYTSVASDRLVTGHFKEAVEWSERSLDLAATLEAERLIPRALSYRGMARCYLGELGGLDDLQRALSMTKKLGLSRDSARLLLILAEIQWATEGPTRALEATQAGTDLAERRGIVDMIVGCRNLSLGPLFDLGRWDELLSVADEVIGWSNEAGSVYAAILAQPWKAQVLSWRGATAEAATLTSEFVPIAREIADPQVVVPAFVAAALVAVSEGRAHEAGRLLEDLDQITEVAIDWYREEFSADLLRICAAIGNIPLGQRLLERAEAFALRHRLSLLSARAALKEALGEVDEALRFHEEAVERWTEYGHVLETGIALLGAGRCLIGLGRPGAPDRLHRARELFEGLGAARLVAETDVSLRVVER